MKIERKFVGGTATVYLRKDEPKPIEGMQTGDALMFIDDQSAGVMFFDGENKCWIDKEGNTWKQ